MLVTEKEISRDHSRGDSDAPPTLMDPPLS